MYSGKQSKSHYGSLSETAVRHRAGPQVAESITRSQREQARVESEASKLREKWDSLNQARGAQQSESSTLQGQQVCSLVYIILPVLSR
jgi:hypothetical protein